MADEPDLTKASDSKNGKKHSDDSLDSSKITVKVYSPYQTYYDGEAVSLSAENDTGPFDILPRHHNFMTLVNSCEVVIRLGDGLPDKNIRISRGVLHVRRNIITLFLDV
jgi:F0F1-type ATP synthase epsilon subunit